jgi:hypothetical protein
VADAGLVRAVTAQVADLTEEQVKAVLTAVQRVQGGDPVGTVLEEHGTGNIAVRVSDQGVPYWHVTSLNGSISNDQQGTLAGWTVLKAI